jgi:CheY-like chemotaxis protein
MAKTIMVVDDEKDNRDTLKTILENEGYNVVLAVNGDDCLKKIGKQKVDLVLMDIMMPGTPVRDVVPKLKNVKVVYLTVVRISEAEKEELLKAKNVVGYIQKPFDIDDLVKKVKDILSK